MSAPPEDGGGFSATVAAPWRHSKRIAHFNAIALEIVRGEVPAEIAGLCDDRLAHVAVDKEARAVLGEPFERLAKTFVAEGVARYRCSLPFGREDLARAFALFEDRGDDGEEVGLEAGERKTLARGAHRRLHQALHGQAAERLVHGEQALCRARCGAGPQPDMELLGGGAEIGVDGEEFDLVRRPALQRRLDEEVEQLDRIASRAPRHEKTAAAGRGEHGLGDEGHARAGNRRVEGIAAIGENLGGRGGSQRVARRDDTLSLAHADVPKAKRAMRQARCLAQKRSWPGRRPAMTSVFC